MATTGKKVSKKKVAKKATTKKKVEEVNNELTYYIDICLSYRDKKYVEGETEKAVIQGIQSGLDKNKWITDEEDIENAIDYQTHSTAIQFNLTVPSKVTEKDIIEQLSLKGVSTNVDLQ